MVMRCVLVCAVLFFSIEAASPKFPLQFEADLEITAHLVDRTKDYPPWLRKIKINYDYIKKFARAEISHGYEAGRTYVRRYDQVGVYEHCSNISIYLFFHSSRTKCGVVEKGVHDQEWRVW